MKTESRLVKRQAREIRRALESKGIYATFQGNFAATDKDNRDDSRDDQSINQSINQSLFKHGKIQQELKIKNKNNLTILNKIQNLTTTNLTKTCFS